MFTTHKLLTFLFLIFFSSLSLKSQVLYFPSGASNVKSEKNYQEAIYALMNFEHRKFTNLIEEIIGDDPTCFKAYAHKAFHQFHMNGSEWPFEKYAKAALKIEREGEEEKLYAKILKEKLKNPEANISPILKKMAVRHKVAEAYFLLGNYYLETGATKEAHVAFYRIFKIDPAFPPAFNLLGHTSMELGRNELAKDFLTQYVKLSPHNPNAYDSYGDFLAKIKDFKGAIKQYEKAYDLSKNYKFALEKAERLKENLAAK